MHQSNPTALSSHLGHCRAFAYLVSPGGGTLANFALPVRWAFAHPGAATELLTRTWFPLNITKHGGFYRKQKQIGSSIKDAKNL